MITNFDGSIILTRHSILRRLEQYEVTILNNRVHFADACIAVTRHRLHVHRDYKTDQIDYLPKKVKKTINEMWDRHYSSLKKTKKRRFRASTYIVVSYMQRIYRERKHKHVREFLRALNLRNAHRSLREENTVRKSNIGIPEKTMTEAMKESVSSLRQGRGYHVVGSHQRPGENKPTDVSSSGEDSPTKPGVKQAPTRSKEITARVADSSSQISSYKLSNSTEPVSRGTLNFYKLNNRQNLTDLEQELKRISRVGYQKSGSSSRFARRMTIQKTAAEELRGDLSERQSLSIDGILEEIYEDRGRNAMDKDSINDSMESIKQKIQSTRMNKGEDL